MGEYVKINKEEVKIGTCNLMYYTSYEKFANHLPFMEKADGSDKPENYLKSNYWRLPFSDEQNLIFGDITGSFDRCITLKICRSDYEDLGMKNHQTFSLSVTAKPAKDHNFNVSIPCPYSENFKNVEASRNIDKGFFDGRKYQYALLNLCYQKYEDGRLLPAVCCPYCGGLWILDEKKDLVNLIKGNRKIESNTNNDIFLKLIKDFKKC
jgi:hypothetical protein